MVNNINMAIKHMNTLQLHSIHAEHSYWIEWVKNSSNSGGMNGKHILDH